MHFGIVRDSLLAASNAQQLTVVRLVPVPVETGIEKCGIESRPVSVALGFRERAVNIEDDCLKCIHGDYDKRVVGAAPVSFAEACF